MTDKTNTDATQSTESGSVDLFTIVSGWVLLAGIVGLGLSILSGKYFHGSDPERPDPLGYVIEGAEEEGGEEAEMTMDAALNMDGVDVSAGERVFAKCVACHTIDAGGANGTGPNLHGIMGANVGAVSGYSYSTAMTSFGGQWGWNEMNDWLANPRRYMDGTKMGFAGLSSIEDRAAVALYMNANGSNLPVPEYVEVVAEGADVAEEEAEAVADQEAAAESAQEDAASTAEDTAAAEASE